MNPMSPLSGIGLPYPPRAAQALNFVFEGDSLTNAIPPGGHNWPFYLNQLLTADGYAVTLANTAVGGDAMAGVSARAASDDARIATGKLNFLSLLCGYNDVVSGGRTVSQLETDVASYTAARATAGWGDIVCTQMGNWGTAKEADRLAYNTWIRANYANVFDFGAEPLLGVQGSYQYPWTNDNLHPNDNGSRVMAARAYVDWRAFRGLALRTVVTSFLPVQATSGTVEIYGVGFTGATAVSFGGTNAGAFTVVSDSHITATLASGATGAVAVTSPTGTATSLLQFTYASVPAATITGYAPFRTTGRWVGNLGDDPGDLLTFTGTNLGSLNEATGGVTFAGTSGTRIACAAGTFNRVTSTSFNAFVPNDLTLAASGTVSADCGANGIATITWTRSVAAPRIDSTNNPSTNAALTTGPAGTFVAIYGEHVTERPLTLTVNGVAAANLTPTTNDAVTFNIPSGTGTGVVPIVLTTPYGTASINFSVT